MVAPLVHLLVSGGPSDQARAARALSNMATDSSVKEQIVAAGEALLRWHATSCDLCRHSLLHCHVSGCADEIQNAGAVSLLIDIVRDGGSAVQSAVVALEKLCSHASGTLLSLLAKFHKPVFLFFVFASCVLTACVSINHSGDFLIMAVTLLVSPPVTQGRT